MDFTQFINHFITLLVIANPLAALPAVLRITQDQSLLEKRKTGKATAIAVGIILMASAWIGKPLLMILGIKLAAFQIAGALVLLFLSFSMLSAEESAMKTTTAEQKEKRASSGAIVPLAIPIIAGPGAISSVIVSVGEFPGFWNLTIITISCLFVAFSMGILLYYASHLEKLFGKSGINVINRLGGLLLASISVQILAEGILVLFPGLGIKS